LINWSNSETTSFISGLPGGTLSVTITDDNGNPGAASITLTANIIEPPQLTHNTPVLYNGNCPGGAPLGEIRVDNINGGTPSTLPDPPYTVKLTGGKTNVNLSTTAVPAIFQNLPNGTLDSPYVTTVVDADGCEVVTGNIFIYVPPTQLSMSLSVDSSDTLKIIATPSGGIFSADPAHTWGLEGYRIQWYVNGVASGSLVTDNAGSGVSRTFVAGETVTAKIFDKGGDSDGCNIWAVGSFTVS